jgi:adenylate cyclase
MNTERAKRKLSAILSADVRGYSRLMGEDEVTTVRTLKEYRELMSKLIKEFRGRVVDSPGDNVLAEFASVVDALECSTEIQKVIKDKNAALPDNRKMEFRIGVNLGDVIEEESRIYGDGVNIAARLEGVAEAGGICISGTAFDQVKNKLPVGYQYLGKQRVKNIADPVRAYKVLMEPEAVGKVIGEEEPRRTKLGWKVAAAAAVLLLVLGGLVWNFYWRAPKIEPASEEKMAYPLPDKPSIAVLPFMNISGDLKQEYLADGITEDIITALSRIPGLFTIARNSTFTYKGKPVKIQQVAEELGVRYVLEGSLQRSGDRIRVTAQLIDALKGHHIMSERLERNMREIFALQDDITKSIITAVRVKLTSGMGAVLTAKGTSNIEAYLMLLEARELLSRFTKDDNALARRKLEDVINLDPSYPNAHGLLSTVYVMDMVYGVSPRESLKKGIEEAKKAVALDDSNASGHLTLGFAYSWKKEHEKGIAENERAVELEPGAAVTWFSLGRALDYACRHEEAIELFKKAIRMNPLGNTVYYFHLGNAYFNVGKYEEGISAHKKALEISPTNFAAHRGLAACYAQLGRNEDATFHAQEVLKYSPKFSVAGYVQQAPWKDATLTERWAEALRKAGLPEKSPLPLPDKPSIAVLPFENMSGDPEQEYFSDGITEEIITALSKTPKLFVIARNSTFTYKGKPVKVQQIGRELGVKYVLEGSVRRSGDQLRITAQLIDATTGNHLWAERYDREMKEIFAIQDEITLQIIKAMQVELTMGETARVTGKGTKNLDAYLRALNAQEDWLRLDKEGSIKARQLATEAIALDPEYGYPYAILAWCYMLDVVRRYSRSPEKSMSLAVEAMQKALALDVSDHRIHRVLSNLYVMQGKHDEAIAASKRALELCPGGAGAYENLGIALLFSCRPIEAIPMLEKAIELDPFPPAVCHRNLAMAYCHVGRYEDAIEQGQKAFQINRKDLSTPFALVFAYAKLGRKEQARAAAAEVLRIDPKFILDSMAETRARMFAAKCHSDRVYEDIEFIRKADVGLK